MAKVTRKASAELDAVQIVGADAALLVFKVPDDPAALYFADQRGPVPVVVGDWIVTDEFSMSNVMSNVRFVASFDPK